MKKNLLICSDCELEGIKQVLGEVTEDGNLAIMRFRDHKPIGKTIITGDNYQIVCERCGQEVYRKEATNGGTMGSIGSIGVLWQSLKIISGTIGA